MPFTTWQPGMRITADRLNAVARRVPGGFKVVTVVGGGVTAATPALHTGAFTVATLAADRRYRVEVAAAWYITGSGSTGMELSARYRAGTSIATNGSDSAVVPDCRATNDTAVVTNVRGLLARGEFNSPGAGSYTFGLFTLRTFGTGTVVLDSSPATLSIDDVGPAV